MENEVNNEVNLKQDNINSSDLPTMTGDNNKKGLKIGKKGLVAIIVGLVLVILLVTGVSVKVITSSPKVMFKKSINNVYKQLNESIDECERIYEIYDFEKKALIFDGDLKVDTNIAEINDDLKGIKLADYTVGGKLGLDLNKEQMDMSAFIKGDSETIDLRALVKDNNIYVKTNLYDKVLKGEDDGATAEFKDLKEQLDKFHKEYEMEAENYDYVIEAFKDALIESLDKEQMSKENDKIKVLGDKINVTKYTYKLDNGALKDLLKDIVKNLEDDKEFTKKLSKMLNTSEEDIEEALNSFKDSVKDINMPKDIEVNIYTKGLFNKGVGLSINYGKEEYFHYYIDDGNIELVADNHEESYGKSVTKIEAKKDGKGYDVTVNYNDEEVAKLKVKEYSSEKIDVDYSFLYEESSYPVTPQDEETKDDKAAESVTGNLYLTSKEEKESVSGEYKFRVEYDGEYLEVQGNYGLAAKDELESMDVSGAVDANSLGEAEEQVLLDKLTEIGEKDAALGRLIDVFTAELEGNVNNNYMKDISDIESVKNLISDSEAKVLYIGGPSNTTKSNEEQAVLEALEESQLENDYDVYNYLYDELPEEFKTMVANVNITCVGNDSIPTNCIGSSDTNCLSVCQETPTIYFIKDGKIVSGLRGKITTDNIELELMKVGLAELITPDISEA